ncbi:MAG: 30S ribosomal protein S1 [Planctomycetaceae bacterium]|nr:30S ribosomal protein S1 [Planctomycetaceae bacterium]
MNDKPNDFGRADAQLDKEVADALGDASVEELMDADAAADATPAPPVAPDSAPAPDPTAPDAPAPPAAESKDPDLHNGTIVAITGDDVLVDLGLKNQGLVSITQFEELPKVGDNVEFIVEGLIEAEGLLRLTRRGAISKVPWEKLEKGMTVEAHVIGFNTGGLELKVSGHRAFMPASQVDLHHVDDLVPLLSHKLVSKVIDIDRRGRNIILSHRAVLEEKQSRQREQVIGQLEVGQIREGTVRNLQDFGAFVDLGGGIDGLIHISDLAYSRVDHPRDVLKAGQSVQVKILKIDAEKNRISLGCKQVQPDPWEGVEHKFTVGAQVSGRVTRIARFGAFVELEQGVEGLVPAGELSWSHFHRIEDIVQLNQVVNVSVLNVDAGRRRIGLSLKQAQADPWADADSKYLPDTVLTGTVTRTTTFGAFVQLEPGVEGLIHISQLADRRVDQVEDVVKTGQEVTVKVVDMDPDQRRIGLSIRALAESAAEPDVAPPQSGKPRGGRRDGGDRRRDPEGARADVRKYVVNDDREAKASESMKSLLDKLGEDASGLKGGIG